jgi:tetratricopeptide (TPR) repeat protein
MQSRSPSVRFLQKKFDVFTNNLSYQEGISYFESILLHFPELRGEDFLCKLGFLYDHLALREKGDRKKKHENKAISLYQEALHYNARSFRALWGIARVWWHRKDKKALQYASRAYRLKKAIDGTSGLYAQHIGLIYESLGNFRGAERWLLRGMREHPDELGSYLNLVVFYRFLKRYDRAQYHAETLSLLFQKQPQSFRRSPWGLQIAEAIRDAGKPLPYRRSS